MISKERVKYMTKLAQYDEKDQRQRQRFADYFRKDYVAIEMLKSLVTGTAAFCLILGVWALYDMEQVMQEINRMDLIPFVTWIVIRYVAFMAVYLAITYIVYNRRYTRGRKELKKYYARLKKVNKLYQDEEGMPGGDDWEV